MRLIILQQDGTKNFFIGECYSEDHSAWRLLPGSVFYAEGKFYDYPEKWIPVDRSLFRKRLFSERLLIGIEDDLYEELHGV